LSLCEALLEACGFDPLPDVSFQLLLHNSVYKSV
jgi:hypothetical protein